MPIPLSERPSRGVFLDLASIDRGNPERGRRRAACTRWDLHRDHDAFHTTHVLTDSPASPVAPDCRRVPTPVRAADPAHGGARHATPGKMDFPRPAPAYSGPDACSPHEPP